MADHGHGYDPMHATHKDSHELGFAEEFLKNTIHDRSNSMELTNDPRFFTNNVIDKRLAALKNLTIVSSLMVGTSMSQLFKLKKEWNFGAGGYCWITGFAQLGAFFLQMIVAFMCLVSLYVMCQQLYHIYRLMTSGPTGVESAGKYYLEPSITLWRHTAVRSLLNGLILFVFASGAILFNKFIKDGGQVPQCFSSKSGAEGPKEVIIGNLPPSVMEYAKYSAQLALNNGTATTLGHEDERTGIIHVLFSVVVLISFTALSVLLMHVRQKHHSVFKDIYDHIKNNVLPSTRNWNQGSIA